MFPDIGSTSCLADMPELTGRSGFGFHEIDAFRDDFGRGDFDVVHAADVFPLRETASDANKDAFLGVLSDDVCLFPKDGNRHEDGGFLSTATVIGSNGEGCHAHARVGGTEFGVAGQATDENDIVDHLFSS